LLCAAYYTFEYEYVFKVPLLHQAFPLLFTGNFQVRLD